MALFGRSIRSKLIVGVSLVHAVLMAIFIFDLVLRQTQFVREEAIRSATGLGQALAANSASWLLMRDYAGLQEIVSSQKQYANLHEALVFSLDGQVLAHTDPAKVGRFLNENKNVPDMFQPTTELRVVEDEDSVFAIVPIRTSGAVVGKAWITIDEKVVNKILGDISRDGVIYTLFAVIIGAVIAGVVVRTMTNHLKKLIEVSEAVRLGQRSLRAGIAGDDEIGRLGKAFDSMLDTLEQNQRALEKARLEANQASVAKGEFLANMSHEIRTPMNGIMGLVNLSLNEPLNPVVHGYLSKVAGSAQALMGVLNDILDFSKLEAGRMRIENAPFSMIHLTDNLRRLYEDNARQKHLEFSIIVEEAVPRTLVGDSLRIQQVLSNLMANAIKFTEKGRVTLHVKFNRIENASVRVWFVVEDTGIGIEAAAIEHLFQPFSQADSSVARRFGGTGLGLAISRSLLELMGTRLKIQSEIGKGSTFHFELVLGLAEQSTHPAEVTFHAKSAGEMTEQLKEKARGIKGVRILVAEDDAVNQLVIGNTLKVAELYAVMVKNGQEALDALENEVFDIVLMDVHMPLVDGIEATKRIHQRAEYKTLPIIALTAGVTQEERERCLAAGMCDFVAKPFNHLVLIDTLTRWKKKSEGELV